MLDKQVSAAEHLTQDWTLYETECEELRMLMDDMESRLDVAKTQSDQQIDTCLDRLQVSIDYRCDLYSID